MKHTPQAEQFTDIVLQVFKLNGQLILEGDKLSNELGLSSARWKVLGAISLSQAPMTVAQIAKNMGLTRQAVQRLANNLKEDGLLSFKNNPHHKRAKLIVLTKKGMNTYEKLKQKQIPWANSIATKISFSDLEITSSVLLKLTAAFEA